MSRRPGGPESLAMSFHFSYRFKTSRGALLNWRSSRRCSRSSHTAAVCPCHIWHVKRRGLLASRTKRASRLAEIARQYTSRGWPVAGFTWWSSIFRMEPGIAVARRVGEDLQRPIESLAVLRAEIDSRGQALAFLDDHLKHVLRAGIDRHPAAQVRRSQPLT